MHTLYKYDIHAAAQAHRAVRDELYCVSNGNIHIRSTMHLVRHEAIECNDR